MSRPGWCTVRSRRPPRRAALERLVASIRRILADAGGDGPGEGAAGRDRDRGQLRAGRRPRGQALWAKLGIGEAIQAQLEEQQPTAPHAAALLAMVAQRLDRPGSKLACHERWLDRVWLPEARDLGLHQLYRALDVLAVHGDAVSRRCFGARPTCSSSTSTWCSTTRPPPGSRPTRRTSPPTGRRDTPREPLRASAGTARRGGTTIPQVVIALAVTREGVPVRSWSCGRRADVATVQAIKADLREMRLGRVLVRGRCRLSSRARSRQSGWPRGPGATCWPRRSGG